MERIIRKPLQSLHDFKTRTSRPPLQPLGASTSAGYNNNQAQQFASGAGALVGHQDADTIKHLASTVGDFNFRSVASCHHIIILYLIFSGRWPGVTCTSWCWIGSRSSAWQSTFTAQTPQSRCREVETQNRYSKIKRFFHFPSCDWFSTCRQLFLNVILNTSRHCWNKKRQKWAMHSVVQWKRVDRAVAMSLVLVMTVVEQATQLCVKCFLMWPEKQRKSWMDDCGHLILVLCFVAWVLLFLQFMTVVNE